MYAPNQALYEGSKAQLRGGGLFPMPTMIADVTIWRELRPQPVRIGTSIAVDFFVPERLGRWITIAMTPMYLVGQKCICYSMLLAN